MIGSEESLRLMLKLNRDHLISMREFIDLLIEGWDLGYQPMTEEEEDEVVVMAMSAMDPEAA